MKPERYHTRKKASSLQQNNEIPGSGGNNVSADISNAVYFSRLEKGRGRGGCLRKALKGADSLLSGFGKGSFVGIKMTIGDEGSTGFIKPELVKILVENIKRRGAKPFVFDTNVIYKGKRQNAVDHLNLAYTKGFTPERLGCPYIIADSVFGTDSKTRKVNFKNIKEIRLPSLVNVLDDLIVLSHVTGHMMSGFAGSIKNVAMGMASRAGKQVQHSSVTPEINQKNCTLCGCCIEMCPVSAITEKRQAAFIHSGTCIGCGECIAACKFNAVKINWKEEADVFSERMAEYAAGILSRIKRKVYFNFAFDITEECDCISGDDPVIAGDKGIFASKDILAVDKACYDLLAGGADVFSRDGRIKTHVHQFKYAGEIGLGRSDYTLFEL
jgi:uncharacterized Fe-S center protein